MSNSVLLKKSSVAAKVPLTTDLAYGELALNYADGKLYFKNASNAIQSFTNDSTTVTLTGTQTLTNKTLTTPTINSATANNAILTGTLTAGGGVGTTGQVLQSTVTGVQWASISGSGTVTSIIAGTGLTGGTITTSGTIAIDSTVVTLTGTQTLTNKSIAGGQITSAVANATLAATATNVAYSGLTGTVPTWNQNTTGSSASTTGNAATVTTNANLAGNVTSVGNATTLASIPAISGASLTSLTAANISAGTAGINITGNAATVTTNANLTGTVTSTGNTTSIASGALSIANTSGLQSALDLKSPLASPTFTGAVTVPTPTNATDASTKAYVDAVAQGLAVKESVRVTTIASLPTNTYANGASGVGATLTAVAAGILTVDGVATVLNDRVLVKNEAAPANNGIYYVSVAGTAGIAYVLTRSLNMDAANEFAGAFCFTNEGTTNSAAGFVCTSANPITVGTTAISFTQFSGAGQLIAGNGLSKSGNTLSINTAITADLLSAQTLSNKTLVSPSLGTPASGVVTNLTGTASININGTVGATTPATGVFTTLTATTVNAFTLAGTVAGGGNQLNNVIIGASTPLAGSFTTLSASGNIGIGLTNPVYKAHIYDTADTGLQVTKGGSGASRFKVVTGKAVIGYDTGNGDTEVLGISSTGLAVTGAISATGQLSVTNALTNTATVDSTTAIGPRVLFSNSAAPFGYIGADKAISGLYANTDMAMYSVGPIRLYGGNQVTNFSTFSSTGLAVTGVISSSGAITGSNLSGTNTGDQTNISGNAATVTTNANLTGNVTSVGNVTTLASIPAISGANLTSLTAANISAGTAGISITGNAATVTSISGNTLTSLQVTTGLGFTPYNSTNPNGYTANTGTVTSISGTGTVNGLTLTGTVTTSGSLTIGGTLSGIANSATTATSANTASAIVARDASGNFIAGTITAALTGNVTGNVTGSSGSTTGNAATATTANALNTANNYQINSLGVGTAASGTAGEIRATNNITSFYSDERLKTKIGDIENPLDKIREIETLIYHANETAVALGYDASIIEVGVTAQSVQRVMPQTVAPAPIDPQYMTVRYERLVPLLIAAIKEQQLIIDSQEARITRLETLV